MANRPRLAMRVADLARSVAFYRAQIGFTLADYQPEADMAVIVDSDGDAILLAALGPVFRRVDKEVPVG